MKNTTVCLPNLPLSMDFDMIPPEVWEKEDETTKGGPGSGYFNHAGRPGKRGGSATGNPNSPRAIIGFIVYGKNGGGWADVPDEDRARKLSEKWGGSYQRYERSTRTGKILTPKVYEIPVEFRPINKNNESEKSAYSIEEAREIIRDRREESLEDYQSINNPDSPLRSFLLNETGAKAVWWGNGDQYLWQDSVNGHNPRGIFFEGDSGEELLLGVYDDGTTLSVDRIFKESRTGKGSTLGVKVMGAMKKYADLKQRRLEVTRVGNPKYFRFFKWLKESNGGLTFYYDPTKTEKGGPGSGNFGHAGRPGEVGGSAPTGSSGGARKPKRKPKKSSPQKADKKTGYSQLPLTPEEIKEKEYLRDEIKAGYKDYAQARAEYVKWDERRRWLSENRGSSEFSKEALAEALSERKKSKIIFDKEEGYLEKEYFPEYERYIELLMRENYASRKKWEGEIDARTQKSKELFAKKRAIMDELSKLSDAEKLERIGEINAVEKEIDDFVEESINSTVPLWLDSKKYGGLSCVDTSDRRVAFADAGNKLFHRLVGDNPVLSSLPKGSIKIVSKPNSTRSDYENMRVNIASLRGDDKSVVHELGHALEDNDPFVSMMCQKFLKSRTTGETGERLAELVPGAGYEFDEYTAKDKFIDPYMGRIYTSMSTKTTSAVLQSTEIMSMGLQIMSSKPTKLLYSDPEYYDFIWAILRAGRE